MTRWNRAVAPIFGAWLTFALPAFAMKPSDHELQVAYCLGLQATLWRDATDRDWREDCAPDALSALKPFCEQEKKTAAEGPQIVERLQDYLAAKQLSMSDSSVVLAAKRGEADYWLTIGADHACLRGPMSACKPVADNPLTRINKCPAIINALPF